MAVIETHEHSSEFVKQCPSCKTANNLTAMFCITCNTSLTTIRKTPRGGVPDADHDSVRKESINAKENACLVCPSCGCSNPKDAERCGRCDDRLRSSAVSLSIAWPWGEETSLTGILVIGREPEFSSLATNVESYANISRRHAEIFEKGGSFFLRDLNSINGTFINNRQLRPHTPERLVSGMEIRFARDLKAIVR